jgi:predicted DsbA family dithiol-disulfide isomerase
MNEWNVVSGNICPFCWHVKKYLSTLNSIKNATLFSGAEFRVKIA